MGLVNIAFLKALGYTLFHSIWQATLIALIMSLILNIIRRDRANTRYLVAVSALFLTCVTSFVTFVKLYNPELPFTGINDLDIINQYAPLTLIENEQSWIDSLNALLTNNIQWITIAWTLGMLFFIARIFIGLNFTNNLDRSSRTVGEKWIVRMLNELKEKAFYHRNINLKETVLLNSPSVVGWIKPIIYLPIGLVNQISPEEAEAVLAHELAHIIRNDFLVNIIQSMVESFYYFHPAVWWISANIRNEREHACDDLAIKIIGDKMKYAKSLIYLQEWEEMASPGLAMNLSNQETPLFDRIKRILNQPKNRHDMKQKIFASLILLFSIGWISASSHFTTAQEEIESEEFELIHELENIEIDENINIFFEKDTVPKSSGVSKSTIIELKDGKIQRLEIDGKKIDESEYEDHKKLVEGLKSKNASELILRHPNFSEENRITIERNGPRIEILSLQEELNHQNEAIIIHRDEMLSRNNELLNRINEDHSAIVIDLDARINERMKIHEDHEAIVIDLESKLNERLVDLEEANETLIIDLQNHDFPQNFHFYHNSDTLRNSLDSLRIKIGAFDFDFPEMREDVRIWIDSMDFPKMRDDVKIYIDSFDFGDFKEMGRDIRIMMDSIKFPEMDDDFNFRFHNNLEARFIREMKKDGLHKDGNNTIKLQYGQLEVNGEALSEDMLEKYKGIYEQSTGTKLLKGSSINIEINENDNHNDDNYRRF